MHHGWILAVKGDSQNMNYMIWSILVSDLIVGMISYRLLSSWYSVFPYIIFLRVACYIFWSLIWYLSAIVIQAVNRITAMTSSRSDWCISRQRTWGVPIPVFYHVQTKEPLMNEETVDHVKCKSLHCLFLGLLPYWLCSVIFLFGVVAMDFLTLCENPLRQL